MPRRHSDLARTALARTALTRSGIAAGLLALTLTTLTASPVHAAPRPVPDELTGELVLKDRRDFKDPHIDIVRLGAYPATENHEPAVVNITFAAVPSKHTHQAVWLDTRGDKRPDFLVLVTNSTVVTLRVRNWTDPGRPVKKKYRTHAGRSGPGVWVAFVPEELGKKKRIGVAVASWNSRGSKVDWVGKKNRFNLRIQGTIPYDGPQ